MQHYDYIYLSPHLDDVVYSCGAQIFEHTSRGRSVMVITLMAGDPDPDELSDYAMQLHERWQISSGSIELRRQEDRSACSLIGAHTLHWPFLDCIYRRNPVNGLPLYQSDTAIFGKVDSCESDLIAQISTRIGGLPSTSKIYAPLSAGNHVDHQITRISAADVIEPASIAYYEDYPYVGIDNEALLNFDSDQNWRSEVVSVTHEALEARAQAMISYRSQLSTFFESEEALTKELGEYAGRVGGERIWHRLVKSR